MKITKSQLKKVIKEEQTRVLIEHELRKMKRIDEGKMKDLAKRLGVPLALVTAIAAGIEAPTSVDIPAEAPGVEQTADAPRPGDHGGSYMIDPETGKIIQTAPGQMTIDAIQQVDKPPTHHVKMTLDKDNTFGPGSTMSKDLQTYHWTHPDDPPPPGFKGRVVKDFKESKMKVTKSQLKKMIQEELGAIMSEKKKKNWAKKASDSIEKKGTEGEFTKYCDGDVTQACVDRAASGSSTKRKKQAAFAANINSHDDLTYPKGKAKKKK